jgi:hypothetical protein
MNDELPGAEGLDPLALGMLVTLSVLTLCLPRRVAIGPLLLMVGLMPMGQAVIVFGLHFHLFRVLMLVGAARVFLRGELARWQLNGLDRLFLWWIALSLLLGSLSQPSEALFINRLGDAFNATFCYIFARSVIVDFEDAMQSIRILAWMSLAIGSLMLVEWSTGHNMLYVFGGVPEMTAIRNGELRCQGAFRHPILAGAYGASGVPLFIALWSGKGGGRLLAPLAIVACLIIVFTSSSSGAVLALVCAAIGLGLWRVRALLPHLRKAAIIALIGMAVVMNAPVWYLLARMSDVVGGTGWHRAWLIDQTIAHFNEWWLFGTTYTAHWGPAGEIIYNDPTMMDITNHFVMEGVKGGVVKLVLFVAIIVKCFRQLGQSLSGSAPHPERKFVLWCLGVSVFTHCVAFISVNYFDQTVLIWFWLIAVVSCVTKASAVEIEDAPVRKLSSLPGDSPWPTR